MAQRVYSFCRDVIFVIPVRHTFQSYSQRFVGIDNTSIFGLELPKNCGRFRGGNLLVFYKALLLASEFPTFYQRCCLALSSFGFSIDHFTFALLFAASHLYLAMNCGVLRLSVSSWVSTQTMCTRQSGLSFTEMILVKPVHASDNSLSPSTFQ